MNHADMMDAWLPRRWASYQRLIGLYNWAFLYGVTEKDPSRRVQQDILYALGLGNYGFIDFDFSALFISILKDTPTDNAREQVQEHVLREVVQAIDQKRAITGLKLEGLICQQVEIATRTQKVIELRQSELEQVRI